MCRIEDDAYYPIMFYDTEAEEPRKPVCLDEKEWANIRIKSERIICPIYLCLTIIFTLIFFDGFGFDFFVFSETTSWCVLLCCLWVLFCGPVAVIRILRKRAYRKAQDSEINPNGYTYQGKILEKENPHYLLHLAQYQKYKTWILPEDKENKE